MPRRSHVLKRNHQTRLPLRIIWVDTEADHDPLLPVAEKQRLKFGVATYHQYDNALSEAPRYDEKIRFQRVDKFWNWVESKTLAGRSVWILAHNWNYDAGILSVATQLIKRGWEMVKYINGKPPLIVRWVRAGATLLMVDTLNYFATSLASLATGMGLKKYTMPAMQKGSKITQEMWEYAEQDVQIIVIAFLSLRSFVRDSDLGIMQPTLASQGMTAFRHRFMHHKILIHDDDLASSLEREAYHGGRTDAFWRGPLQGPLYKLDVNSMYPSIMRTQKIAYWIENHFPKFDQEWWDRARSEDCAIVARCLLNTDDPAYGVVMDQKLMFPIGKFETVLTTPEIDYAEANGHLVSIGEFAYYKRDILFDLFVDFFHGQRLIYRSEGNAAFDYMSKILMNTLYGKWGQAGRRWEESEHLLETSFVGAHGKHLIEDPDNPNGRPIELRNRLGVTQELKRAPESENSFPMICAEITAYARIQLHTFIKTAGPENVFYCDTDSLLVNAAGYDRLAVHLDANVLGKLKLEKTAEGAEIKAPKHYQLDSEKTIKGIKKNAAIGVPNVRGSSLTQYRQPMFRSWDYNLSRNQDGFIEVIPIVKTLSEINTKRIVRGNGPTYPIVLEL